MSWFAPWTWGKGKTSASQPNSQYGDVYKNPYAPVNPGDLTTKGGLNRGLWTQYGQNQAQQASTNRQRDSEYGTLMPQYQSLLNSGYSPEEKSGIQQGTLGAIQGNYGAATDAASRRMARTNNSAGYDSFLGASARSKSRDMAQQELDNQKLFADEAMRRKMVGLQGIASLYGVDTSFLNSLGNQQLGVLGIGSNVESRRKGKIGDLNAGLNLVGLGG